MSETGEMRVSGWQRLTGSISPDVITRTISAILHNFTSGKIAYFTHRTKRGKGSNWSGTSAGAETDMLDELLGQYCWNMK